MKSIFKATLVAGAVLAGAQAFAQVTFYENDNFQGRYFSANGPVNNFQRSGFNDRASSVSVNGGRWEACDDVRFGGRCVVLRPGNYPSLSSLGLNDRISSVRPVGNRANVNDDRYAPAPVADYNWRRRADERLFEANVTSVRAVMATTTEQRCWVERREVSDNNNVGGAIIGGILGGILGHQVGGGRGNDIATAGGAVAGAAIGANAGGSSYSRDVQRCRDVPTGSRPQYWDVTYEFRGQQHNVQLSSPPGPTVTVNNRGEPREG